MLKRRRRPAALLCLRVAKESRTVVDHPDPSSIPPILYIYIASTTVIRSPVLLQCSTRSALCRFKPTLSHHSALDAKPYLPVDAARTSSAGPQLEPVQVAGALPAACKKGICQGLHSALTRSEVRSLVSRFRAFCQQRSPDLDGARTLRGFINGYTLMIMICCL